LLDDGIGKPFEHVDELAMETPLPLLEHGSVDDVSDETVPESHGASGSWLGVLDEATGLQAGEARAEVAVGDIGDGMEQGNGDFPAYHRGGLQDALVFRCEAINSSHEDSLDGGGDLERAGILDQSVGSVCAGEGVRLDQTSNALFQIQRVPLRLLDEQTGQRLDARVDPQKAPEKLLHALGRERVDLELSTIGTVTPSRLVLGPVSDKKKHASRGKALDDPIEESLRLGVDPLQILHQNNEWMGITRLQEEPRDGVDRALTPLIGLEVLPAGIHDRHVEKAEERSKIPLPTRSYRAEPLRYLGPHVLRAVRWRNLEILPEELEDR
jgi:hypothetical protein